MIIDPTSDIGKVRLRVGDYSDLPYFPDEVYQSVLDESNGNVPKASTKMATYILAMLTGNSHQKLAQIEVWGSELFTNYLSFVKATILNPNLMTFAPLPYTPLTLDQWGNVVEVPLVQFQKDWNANYTCGTQSEQMHFTAQFAPAYSGFDGTTYF